MTASQTFALGVSLLNAHPARTSADISAVMNPKSAFAFVQSTADGFDAYDVDVNVIFSLPQKQIKRACQFVNAVTGGVYKQIDATSACGLYALRLSPDNSLEYDALHFLIAGHARAPDAMGSSTKGVGRSILARLFSRVGVNTVSTQKSRSFGNNGFCDALGMTGAAHGKVNRDVSLNVAHPLCVEFFRMVDRATESQIDDIGSK